MNAHDKWLQEPYARQEVDHEMLEARIASEADVLMHEWSNAVAAENAVHDNELLLDDRAQIVAVTCAMLQDTSLTKSEQFELIGRFISHKIKVASMVVATYSCTKDM